MGQEMGSFFPEPRDPDSLPPHDAQPEWAGPPDDVMPVPVPIHLILSRSDNAVVVLTRVRAYRSGLALSITAQTRQADRYEDLGRELMWHPDIGGPDPSWHANRFKWGVEFADGRKATNVDPDRGPADGRYEPDWKPDHPVLMINGGSFRGQRAADVECWLWPLPPPGPLRVVCQWPGQGIDLNVHELEAQPFLEAAARADPLWPKPE